MTHGARSGGGEARTANAGIEEALDSERADIEAAGIRSEFEVRAWRPLTGGDLTALAAFRRHVIGKEKQIEARREEARRKLESRKTA